MKMGFGSFKKMGKGKGDDLDEEDLETLSYKKLEKMIVENHPCDPNTGERFPIGDRVTVKNFYKKLFDICMILKCIKMQKKLVTKIKNFIDTYFCECCKRVKHVWPKPKSLEKLPDSESDDGDDGGETNARTELTECSRNLGEGTVLYL